MNRKKHYKYILCVIALAALFTGCGKKKAQDEVTQSTIDIFDSVTSVEQLVTETPEETSEETPEATTEEEIEAKEYHFKNHYRLQDHYEKHGKDMGFPTAEEYEKAASDVVNNRAALHKTEKEDGDDVYYIEETNEFVVVSTEGYIRTYFKPDRGIDYYNSQ